ncbi:hypothetical protein SPRG_10720 [Saprolegnia parasitica CBS 223.65]|uniref:Uncharacterized protein n=1 Tax=Saprolegnia parasitica (strain CBS 223.65) TaxID=695850 RepID=A0A067CAE9_SAPPC|nr:hypothetical protein SPRG_10720 [Saprolegnia parasitica CBS 223.65]KDO23526.1 hypothetical protein SPRG_10720 [Saprolegnia parasitica CBS 223.65]|eukprot:XP_012205678.1 hypothetical protein SPRG_10720 [Saprolegnia parasitica CBS 223.65]
MAATGWDCFDDSSDDEVERFDEDAWELTPERVGRITTELLRTVPSRREAHGVEDASMLLPPAATLAQDTAALRTRLEDAGYIFPDASTTDVAVDLEALTADMSYEATQAVLTSLHARVLPGGVVITRVPPMLSVDFVSEHWALPRVASLSGPFANAATRIIPGHCLVAVQTRTADVNPKHYRLEPATAASLDHERNWVDRVTLGRTFSERQHGVLSVESHARACSILRDYGVVVLRGLFNPETVRKYGAAALSDFAQVAEKLAADHDMDVFNPGEKPPSRNFVEFATREAFRCDLRHTPALTSLRSTEPAEDARTSDGINPRHPVVVAILQDVAQPDAGPVRNAGNYGMWNFSFGGPGSRQRLLHGEIGAIVSTPGCFDQKIHADIPHLFNTLDLPPHLLHAFLPACDAGGYDAGQTAFVVESHFLETCARMTNEDGSGIPETIAKTIRPHVTPGDLVLFDCRVLHLGLSNTTAPMGSKDGVRRPILYVNWHLPWFEDKKNWERVSLFKSV